MGVYEELQLWIYFWCGSAIIISMFWIFIQIYYHFKNKKKMSTIVFDVTDVLKEEKDTLEASGLDEKKVKNAIVTKARMWFLNHA